MGDPPLTAAHRRRELAYRPPRQRPVGGVELQILGGLLRRDRLNPAAHDEPRPLTLAAGVSGVLIIAGPGPMMRLTHPPALLLSPPPSGPCGVAGSPRVAGGDRW